MLVSDKNTDAIDSCAKLISLLTRPTAERIAIIWLLSDTKKYVYPPWNASGDRMLIADNDRLIIVHHPQKLADSL